MAKPLKFADFSQSRLPFPAAADPRSFEFSYKAVITNIYPMTESENLYHIQIIDPDQRQGFRFKPGQFVMLELPGVGEAPFSIPSSPSRNGSIELCIRAVGNFTNFLARVPRGTQVGIRGPFGTHYPLEKMYDRDIIMIAGGLGIVPLRSPIVTVLENRNRFGRVDVLYGARKPSELLFTYEYEMWHKFNVDLVISVDVPDDSWHGSVGRITEPIKQLIARRDDSLAENTYAIVCGPPVMFKPVCSLFMEAGLPMQKIFVSLERRMHCGSGKCCRCNVGSTYTCLDGPIFDYWTVMNLKEAI